MLRRPVHLIVGFAVALASFLAPSESRSGEVGYTVVLQDFNGDLLPIEVVFDDADMIGSPTSGRYNAVAGGFELRGVEYQLTAGVVTLFASSTSSQFAMDLQFSGGSGPAARLLILLATPFGDPGGIVFTNDALPAPFPDVALFSFMHEFQLMIGTEKIPGVVAAVEILEARDTTPPDVLCQVSRTSLWPANRKLLNVGFEALVMDDEDDAPAVDLYVLSDEPDAGAKKSPDAVDLEPNLLKLRAERLGKGNGRVYLILVIATDEAGNVGVDCCRVVVPHDKSAASLHRVNDEAAAATAECLSTGEPLEGYHVIATRSW